jgi:hypothetical protein
VKEAIMHPRHGDEETRRSNWLTGLAVALFLVLLAGTAIKFDLWKVPPDDPTATLLPDGTATQPVTTAQRRD